MAENDFDFSGLEKRLGVSRRTFLKFCTGVAASLGALLQRSNGNAGGGRPEEAPPVIWLHGQEVYPGPAGRCCVASSQL